MNRRQHLCALTLLLVWGAAGPVQAQIEENLSSYTGANARGYLEPLEDALGSALSDGLYTSADIPDDGFYARLDVRGMLVSFGDEDRTFRADTEPYYPDPQTVTASTVVGDESSQSVSDPGSGATFLFPGGLNLDRFGLAVPQVVFGGVSGFEGMVRYVAVDIGDDQIGDISLFGIGGRHSLSRYFADLPVSLAAMVFYQSLSVGEDFLDARQFSIGVQASKRFGVLEPYGGIGLDSFDFEATYDADQGGSVQSVSVDFDRENNVHLTAGAAARFAFVHLNGEINITDQFSVAFGLSLGN